VAIQSSIDSSVSSRVLTPRFQISTVGETVVRDLAYLQAEFPTEWPRLPNISSTVTHSLAKFFVSKLPEDPRIERVYWAFEGAVLRIWTIIDNPDYEFEKSIYEAQLEFMDAFRDLECDFSVIYRLGKPVEYFKMEGAMLASREL